MPHVTLSTVALVGVEDKVDTSTKTYTETGADGSQIQVTEEITRTVEPDGTVSVTIVTSQQTVRADGSLGAPEVTEITSESVTVSLEWAVKSEALEDVASDIEEALGLKSGQVLVSSSEDDGDGVYTLTVVVAAAREGDVPVPEARQRLETGARARSDLNVGSFCW